MRIRIVSLTTSGGWGFLNILSNKTLTMEAGSEGQQFKPRICVWEDLSLTDTEELQKCGSNVGSVQRMLQEVLGVTSKDKQSLIELDLYTYAILFAKTNNYSPPQMSAFFTIIKSVHKLCISTPFDNQERALELFNNLIVRHGVTRPPYSMALFSLAQVKSLTDYVLSSYFKHYKMYKYAFTKRVRLGLKLVYDGEDQGEDDGGGKEEEAKDERKEVEEVEKDTEEPATLTDDEKAESPIKEEDSTNIIAESEEADQNDLKDIVTSTLSKKFKDLEMTIEQEMNTQERKLSERIGALEQLAGEKTKQKR